MGATLLRRASAIDERIDSGTCTERGRIWILMIYSEGNEFYVSDNGSPAGNESVP